MEEDGTVRTDEVNTSELLQSLNCTTGSETLAEGTTDDLEVGGLAETKLELVVCLDLRQFLDDSGIVDVDAAKTSKGLGSLLMSILLDEEAGGLGQNNHTSNQNNGPGKLNSHGNPVAAGIIAVLGGVVDNGSKQQTKGDGQLVSTDNSTTNPLGSSLGLVERNSGREQTNSKTGEESTSHEERNSSRGSLEDNTEAENKGVQDHGKTTTEVVGHRSGE